MNCEGFSLALACLWSCAFLPVWDFYMFGPNSNSNSNFNSSNYVWVFFLVLLSYFSVPFILQL